MRARLFSAIFLGLMVALAGFAAPPAAAQAGRSGEGVQPLDRLLPGIRRNHPGDFYDAEGPTYGPSGDPHYHLKWMTPDGRVIWYDTDARSGRVLRSSPGRDSFDAPGVDPRAYRGARPYLGRYPPYMAEPYDRGYGRSRNFGRGYGGPGYGYARPGHARPWGGWRGGGGRGGGRGWRH